jgi:hypothetical protein
LLTNSRAPQEVSGSSVMLHPRRRAAAIIVSDAVWRNVAKDKEQIDAAVPRARRRFLIA